METATGLVKCPRCGQELRAGKAATRHVKKCLTLPTAEELAAMLDNDELASATSLAKQFGVGMTRIIDIIMHGDTHWTREMIAERGQATRYGKQVGQKRGQNKDRVKGRYPCANDCGMMVKKEGHICRFCALEAAGIRSRADLKDLPPDDPRFLVLRTRNLCFTAG
jgi:hypothetical protein